jgi:hypothetical protein
MVRNVSGQLVPPRTDLDKTPAFGGTDAFNTAPSQLPLVVHIQQTVFETRGPEICD